MEADCELDTTHQSAWHAVCHTDTKCRMALLFGQHHSSLLPQALAALHHKYNLLRGRVEERHGLSQQENRTSRLRYEWQAEILVNNTHLYIRGQKKKKTQLVRKHPSCTRSAFSDILRARLIQKARKAMSDRG